MIRRVFQREWTTVAPLAFSAVLKLAFYVVLRQAYCVEGCATAFRVKVARRRIWAQIRAIWAQFGSFSERRAKPLLYRERGRKPSGHEKGLETSAIQRKRCENGPDLCRVWAKVASKTALKVARHNKDTISVPMGVSERQKGPSEPSDYLGLRVSHSLSRQRSRVRAPSSPP